LAEVLTTAGFRAIFDERSSRAAAGLRWIKPRARRWSRLLAKGASEGADGIGGAAKRREAA